MRTGIIVALVILLCVSAAGNVAQWRALRHDRDVRVQEADYAKAFASRTFTLTPEDGMAFYRDVQQKEPCETLLMRFDAGMSSTTAKPGDENYGWHGHGNSDAGAVDTSRMAAADPQKAPIAGRRENDMSSSYRVLYRLLGQICRQDAGWMAFGTGRFGGEGAVGYLSHPAGMLTVVVRPFPRHPNMELIEYTWQFGSAPARGGGGNSCATIQPQGQCFQPK